MSSMSSAVETISDHILTHLMQSERKPLFVALQGPQGSGKSYLSALVMDRLSAPPHNIRVCVLSLDDIYLTHDGLTALAHAHPSNHLWNGRGQPGTHDVLLGTRVLNKLREGFEPVELPRFDKSLFAGEGDRLPLDGTGSMITPPVDVVLFEGWCIGFCPVSNSALESTWEGKWKQELTLLKLDPQLAKLEDVVEINDALQQYIPLWRLFNIFVQLQPVHVEGTSQYSVIYKWRLEQEHYMKAHNGGKGMSDDQVKKFVDRYIPGYVFFGDGITQGAPDFVSPWLGKGLRIVLSANRDVVGVKSF
ncbi:P-loop containing nucleoside triphosphate hydrolase protein [Fistulina hepatica ATCC 64428]|uniref:p-loop containing nucleoside triphosphate hydrolase protein n=1 Tax=Fistulina hepatica ATCC 64428 TaxID=1128425 RepID=A0A0D7AHF9_9AGAR|nr:P-loop containing nucleoside triphosphate hydrolase protein [Fistulina hepatica ATCC 64428]